MKVAITGGTGFIGQAAARTLLDSGYDVLVLSRDSERARLSFGGLASDSRISFGKWSLSDKPENLAKTLEGCDGIVHLAGENIGSGRWTAGRKQKIVESRTLGTRAVVSAIEKMESKPKVLVSGSGIGYYGNRGDEIVDESSSHGTDFLANLTIEWERLAREAEKSGVRVVIIRTGVVIGRDGGALEKMVLPFRMFAGGPLGSGRQWFPWIHMADIVGLIRFSLENTQVKGPVNGCAPDAVRLKEFCDVLGRVLGRPSWLPVPGIVLKAALGEQAVIVLGGQHAVPKAARAFGYHFRYAEVEPALREVLG